MIIICMETWLVHLQLSLWNLFMLSMHTSDTPIFDLSLYIETNLLLALSFNVMYEQSLTIFTYLIAFIFQNKSLKRKWKDV